MEIVTILILLFIFASESYFVIAYGERYITRDYTFAGT